jgi:hypothetical protein
MNLAESQTPQVPEGVVIGQVVGAACKDHQHEDDQACPVAAWYKSAGMSWKVLIRFLGILDGHGSPLIQERLFTFSRCLMIR